MLDPMVWAERTCPFHESPRIGSRISVRGQNREHNDQRSHGSDNCRDRNGSALRQDRAGVEVKVADLMLGHWLSQGFNALAHARSRGRGRSG